jgi:hypothetical protein
MTDKAKFVDEGVLILPMDTYAASVYGSLQASTQWVRLNGPLVLPWNEFFHAPGALNIGSDLPENLLDAYYGTPGCRSFRRKHSTPVVTAYATRDEIRDILERDGTTSDGNATIATIEELLR